jgi:hypothetical protein
MLDLKNYSIIEIYSLFFKNIFRGKMNIDLYLGVFYMTIHIIYIILLAYLLIFNYNFIHNCVLFVIVYVNVIFILWLRTCPLVLIEKKYLNTSCLKTIFFFKNKKNKENNKNKENKEKKEKVFSKYLDYTLDETSLLGLSTLNMLICVKILIMICFLH